MTARISHAVHLRAGGVSVMADLHAQHVVGIAYWGEDLGPLPRAEAEAFCVANPALLGLVMTPAYGWPEVPSVHVENASPRFAMTELSLGDAAARFGLIDQAARLALEITLAVSDDGVFSQRVALQNVGEKPAVLRQLGALFPVGAVVDGVDRADGVLTLSTEVGPAYAFVLGTAAESTAVTANLGAPEACVFVGVHHRHGYPLRPGETVVLPPTFGICAA